MALFLERGFEIGDVALQRFVAFVRDRAGAHPTRAPGLARGAGKRCRPGIEFWEGAVFARLAPVIGALDGWARLDAGEAVVDIGDKAGAPLLAIRDDVDAGLALAAHGFGDRAFDPRREERLVDRFPLCFL